LGVLVKGQAPVQRCSVIVVNPARYPHVKKDLAQTFADWVLVQGQGTIASCRR
jgi:tungstate transport system substrate-binding protein